MNHQEYLNQLADVALLGEEAKKFLESDLYKSLIARAEQETLSAMEQLLDTDPSDAKKIASLQNKASLGRQFPDWIREIIGIGENAADVWRQHGNID